MSKGRKATAVIVFVIMLLAVTAIVLGHHKWNRRDFSTLGPVTSVTVVGPDGSKQLVKITDQQVVFQIVAFVDSRRTDWERQWSGLPLPAGTREVLGRRAFRHSFSA